MTLNVVVLGTLVLCTLYETVKSAWVDHNMFSLLVVAIAVVVEISMVRLSVSRGGIGRRLDRYLTC